MEERTRLLSKRLQALADMVTVGNTVADVGCDHGFVSIYLVQKKLAPRVLAMDVRTGPLEGAKDHILQAGLGEHIETRLSDGLEKLEAGEAKTLIIAGMGGPLMLEILRAYPQKTASFEELILQPQSEIPQFRHALRTMGYISVEEKIILEDGKYYFPMRFVKGQKAEEAGEHITLEDRFGPGLLKEQNNEFLAYLEKEEKTALLVKERLVGSDSEKNQSRLKEIEQELDWIAEAKR